MRIVQVSVGSVRMPPKEGSAPLQVIFNISKQLAKMGHEVIILDRKYSKNDPPIETIDELKIVRLNSAQVGIPRSFRIPRFVRFVLAELNALLFALKVSTYLKRNSGNIDVLHLNLTSLDIILSISNTKLRGKMFYTSQVGHWTLASKGLNLFERIYLFLDSYLMRRVKRVIAVNESAKESFISIGKVKAENVAVVPNGIDTDFFNPSIDVEETAERYGIEGKMTVLFVGRLAEIKGVEYLVKAADIIVNDLDRKDTLFLLVGPLKFDAVEKPINMEEMLGYIRQHQLESNLIFTGALPLEEVKRLYVASDIFVLPSLAEGDPLVVVEAMASGTPIVGTKVGGIPQKVRDGWNGFLIDPENERQLADKIKYLIDNPEERKRMGVNSRRYAEEEFDWSKVAERLSLVYQTNQHITHQRANPNEETSTQ